MKNYVPYILAFHLFSLTSVYAGGVRDIGNGGETVVCRNTQGQIQSIEMLDTYEGRVLNGHNLNLGPTHLSFEQKVRLGLERVLKRDPTRGQRLLRWYETFFKGVQWETQTLPATPDVDPTLFPKNCKIEQIAIQTYNWNNRDWYDYGAAVRINKPLWDALNADQKAILVIHEIIYHEALPSHLQSAKPVRDYTSFVTTAEFENLTDLQYVDLLGALRAHVDMDINNLNMMIPTFIFSDRGIDYLRPDQKLDWRIENFHPSGRLKKSQIIADQDFTTVHGQVLPLNTSTIVTFYDKARYLESGYLRRKTSFQTANGDILVHGQFMLDENQQLKSGILYEPQTLQINSELKIPCDAGKIEFANQELQTCMISENGNPIETSTFRLTPKGKGMILLKDKQIDFETPTPYQSNTYEGTLQIFGDSLKTNLVVREFNTNGNYYYAYPGRLLLGSPASIKLRGTNIRLEGKIEIYNGNRLASFQPTHNFEYLSENVKVPIAASYRCGMFSQEEKASIVKLDREGHLVEFTASRPAKYKGRNLKMGSRCSTYKGELQCYDSCKH